MNAIVSTYNNSITQDMEINTEWMRYFSIPEALEGVYTHLAGLISARTPEKHTQSTYLRGLLHYFKWSLGLTSVEDAYDWEAVLKMVAVNGILLPKKNQIQKYIAHLLHEKEWKKGKTIQRGISAQSATNAYLAPLRIFLRELKTQHIPVHGKERDFVLDCKEQIGLAIELENPKVPDDKGSSPMWRADFVRLNPNQLNVVLASVDRTTLIGARDYALLRLLFESALRASEAQRVTLKKVTPRKHFRLVTVRGKRLKTKPVAVSAGCYDALCEWVNQYNADLSADDPRYITDETPIFQALRRGGNHFGADEIYNPDVHKSSKGKLRPDKGIHRKTLSDIVCRRTGDALGKEFACKPHDCRRTFAYIMWLTGEDMLKIKEAMRHEKLETTYRYIGVQPDYDATLLSNHMDIA